MSDDNEIRKEMKKTVAGEDPAGSGDEENESLDSVNPDLLKFFDAMDSKSYDRMFESLRKLSDTATQKELDDIYTVLDMKPSDGNIRDQVTAVANQLKTLRKYDGERLR